MLKFNWILKTVKKPQAPDVKINRANLGFVSAFFKKCKHPPSLKMGTQTTTSQSSGVRATVNVQPFCTGDRDEVIARVDV